MSRHIALVSCAEARHHDHDLDPIIRALGDRGVVTSVVNWDEPSHDWSQYEAALVRSPWDYHRRYQEFLTWIRTVSLQTTVMNSVDIIEWNTDKRYLQEMIDSGIPTIPTTFVTSAEQVVQLDALLDSDVVVKPTVSAGSNDTERHQFNLLTATAHVTALLDAGKHVMVQPYQRFIDERGETGMLYFNGQFSHAFRKGAILSEGQGDMNGLFVEEDIRPRRPSDQELELGELVLEFVRKRYGQYPLYARVDVVRGSAGVPVVMEVELTEPSLFLHTSADSAARFAAAVLGSV